MTMTEPQQSVEADLWNEPVYDEAAVSEAERRLAGRFDRNFVLIEVALTDLRKRIIGRIKRPRRTAGAARLDPDDIRAGRVILAATISLGVAAGAASFSGQIAMAPHTYLPVYLYWLVPVFIDLPLAYLGWMRLIFRRRKQKATATLLVMLALTFLSVTINVTHVLDQSGILTGTPITFPAILGAVIMGTAPLLIVYSWEEVTKLLVKPYGEKTAPAPAPVERTTPRKRATK